MSLRDRARRFNSTLLKAAKKHVRKSKTGRYTKPQSTSELREAIKKRNGLRRTITGNRADYVEACAETRKLPELVRYKKWEECLADLDNNPDPASKRRTIKSLSRTPLSTIFVESLVHKSRTVITNKGKANAFMKEYAAVNHLRVNKEERECTQQPKSPAAGECSCAALRKEEF